MSLLPLSRLPTNGCWSSAAELESLALWLVSWVALPVCPLTCYCTLVLCCCNLTVRWPGHFLRRLLRFVALEAQRAAQLIRFGVAILYLSLSMVLSLICSFQFVCPPVWACGQFAVMHMIYFVLGATWCVHAVMIGVLSCCFTLLSV